MRPFDLFFQLKTNYLRNRPLSLVHFFQLLKDRPTDQQTYFPIEMPFYISVMFLGFPNEILEEKPLFLDFENNWLRTDRRTDGPTD